MSSKLQNIFFLANNKIKDTWQARSKEQDIFVILIFYPFLMTDLYSKPFCSKKRIHIIRRVHTFTHFTEKIYKVLLFVWYRIAPKAAIVYCYIISKLQLNRFSSFGVTISKLTNKTDIVLWYRDIIQIWNVCNIKY